jgi:hypothetical protein
MVDGITHPITAFADQTEYEKPHIITGFFDVVMTDTEPASPSNGNVRFFFVEATEGANLHQTIGIKFADGSVWPLADRTI